MHQPVFEEGVDLVYEEPEAEPSAAMVAAHRHILEGFDAYRFIGVGEHGRAEPGMVTFAEGALVIAMPGSRLQVGKGALAVLSAGSQAEVFAGGHVIAGAGSLVLAHEGARFCRHHRSIVVQI
jgi:hypothetical protein